MNKRKQTKKTYTLNKKVFYIFLILLLMLIYIIGKNAFKGTSNKAADSIEIKNTSIVNDNSNKIPSPPVSKFNYAQTLKNKVVDVQVDNKVVYDSRPYIIQCAAFKNKKQAEQLKAKIQSITKNVTIKKTTSQTTSTIWYKVLIGPYKGRRLAQNDAHLLSRNKIGGCLMIAQ